MPNIVCVPLEIKFQDAAPPELACPTCSRTCRRKRSYERQLSDVDLDRVSMLVASVGTYHCYSCDSSFTPTPTGVGPRARYTVRAKKAALDSVLEDKMPFVSVAVRMNRDFHATPHSTTILRWFRSGTPPPDVSDRKGEWSEINVEAVRRFSGVLVLDELYDQRYALVTATDPKQDQPLCYFVTSNGVTKNEIRRLLDRLRKAGIDPSTIITDDSALYPAPLREIFPRAWHQLCLFHYTMHITDAVLGGLRSYRKTLPKKRQRRRGRPSKRGRPRVSRPLPRTLLRLQRHLIVKRRENMTPEELQKLDELLAVQPKVRVMRDFMDEYYAVFDRDGGSLRRARLRRTLLLHKARYRRCRWLQGALELLADDHDFDRVIGFLRAPAASEATSNHVERTNRRYRKRQKSHYRLRSDGSIRAALHRMMHYHGRPVDELARRRGKAVNTAPLSTVLRRAAA
jgi:hypothetical protein